MGEVVVHRTLKPRAPLIQRAIVAQPTVVAPPEATLYDSRRRAWNAFLIIDLVLFGLSMLAALLGGVVALLAPDSEFARSLRAGPSEGMLAANAWLSLVMFAVVPIVWVGRTRVAGWRGIAVFFGFHRFGRSLWVGTGLAGLLLLLPLTLAAFGTLSGEASTDEGILKIGWGTALLVSVSAGVGEEIFFRGLLQRWLGWFGQAAVFGLAHFGSGYLVSFFAAFGVGALFGFLRQRGWSLWALIVGHAVYDMTLFTFMIVQG